MAAGAPAGPARPNPFAFPSNVDFAFGLLVAVVVGVSLTVSLAIGNTIASGFETQAALNARCEAAAGPRSDRDTLQVRERWLTRFDACQHAASRPAGAVLIGLAALTLGAAAIYLLSPRWRIRRSRYVPLTAEETPEVVAALRDLCREAGVGPEPEFLWNPLNMACTGLAFGLPRRRCVAISGGLVTKLWTDPGLFRSVVLHELAHLRNGDVDRAYATVAIWWSFVATSLLPFALLVPWIDPAVLPRRILSLAALALVVVLLRDAALRARETFADVRASTWPPFADGLDRALPSDAPPGRGPRSAARTVRRWLSRHPAAASRRAAMRDPSPLFATSFRFAVGAGVAGSLSWLALATVVDVVVPGAGDWTAAVVFAGLVVGVAGLAQWRAACLASVRREPVRGTWRVALGLAAGMALGDLVSVSGAVSIPDGFALTGAALAIFDLVWYGLLFAGTALFLRWTVACASTWLPAVARRATPRLAFALGAAPSVLVLAVGLQYLFSIATFRISGGILPGSMVAAALSGPAGFTIPDGPYVEAAVALGLLVVQVATSPVFYAAMQLLWLIPLGAWFLRRRAAPVATAAWALLDRAPAAPAWPAERRPLRPGLCAAVGIAGGLAFAVVDVPVTVVLALTSLDAVSVWIVYGQLVLGVLTQMTVAFALAVSIRRLGAIHGLFGAFVCGCGAALAALAATLLVLGMAGLRVESLVTGMLTAYLNLAALLTLPVSLFGAGLASWFRRLAGERTEAPAPAF